MQPRKFTPPTLTSLVVEALRLGVDTTNGLTALLGGKRSSVRSALGELEGRGVVIRVGVIEQPGRKGPPLRRWEVAARRRVAI